MKMYNFRFRAFMSMVCIALLTVVSSCSDDKDPVTYYDVAVSDILPSSLPETYTVASGSLTFKELNTGEVIAKTLPLTDGLSVPAGTYNVEGRMTVRYDNGGVPAERSLRAVASQMVVSADKTVNLEWFFFNSENTLIFGEIFLSGTLNATGKTGLYDSYFTIYNNTDQVQYADGLAICESKIVNSVNYEIVSPENFIDNNFTAQTVYVIPGGGTDVPVNPGEYIKIVDQAIDWNAQVPGAMDHTDADFEWYDEVTSGNVRDTDNPSVPNLDKWYSYSRTIWLPSQQCNRSYALVRFPDGMTPERFVMEQACVYTYLGATGKEMTSETNKLIKNEWIIDGVNLCPTEAWKRNSLTASVDMSYAAISGKNNDPDRYGKKFVRKKAGISTDGNVVLQDTDDSANDFEVVSVK